MAKTINTRMSQKHDIEANWKQAVNFTPLAGEIIVYDVDENNPNERIKIGNGVDNVNNLEFFTGDYSNLPVIKGEGESSVKIDGSYEGVFNAANGAGSVAMGGGAVSKSDGAHTEGILTTAGRITQADTTDVNKVINTIGPVAAEIGMPFSSQADIQAAAFRLGGFGAHAEGTNTQALGSGAHAEGSNSLAFANGAHAEGDATVAKGQVAHAEGWNTQAIGNQSHAEGSSTIAKGKEGHAEGKGTKAIGQGSHAEGNYTEATGRTAHAEGEYTEANAKYSHSEGWHTVTDEQCGHVQGKYNKSKSGYAHVVGNGNENTPSDAHTLDWQGNAWFAGDVTLGIDNKLVATEEYVNNAIANLDIGSSDPEAITIAEIDAICK